jgi:enoyl-CoA hydratase/carnithine racemase
MSEASRQTVVECKMVQEHIALVTLCRPRVRNAVDQALASALDRLVRELEESPDVWAVVLTGSGQAFCSGADLKEVAAGQIDGLWTEAGFAGFVNAKRTKPWIAAANGPAVAGGFEIALACEFIVASSEAVFALPEVTRGLLPAAGGCYRLPRALPRAVALELILTGGTLDAIRAQSLGLVNRVTERDRTVESAIEFAAAIVANAPLAVREALAVARLAHDLDQEALNRLSLDAQARLELTDDFKEGPRAFIEKRAPRWSAR